MKRSWIILAVAAILVVTLGVVAGAGSNSLLVTTTPAPQTQGTERAVLTVEGMACSSCAATVRAMMERTPGVARADVSLERAEAVVEFDPERVTVTDLVGVVDRMGYRAQLRELSRREK